MGRASRRRTLKAGGTLPLRKRLKEEEDHFHEDLSVPICARLILWSARASQVNCREPSEVFDSVQALRGIPFERATEKGAGLFAGALRRLGDSSLFRGNSNLELELSSDQRR